MNRTQRRHFERQLQKLYRSDNCSICGRPFQHNTRTAGGFDAYGTVVVAGECCLGKVAEIFTKGIYTKRDYDFLSPRGDGPKEELTAEQITTALAAYQEVIASTDKDSDDTLRRGGGMPSVPKTPKISVLDHPWKTDDRIWFERNPDRSHRTRTLFPGEADGVAAKTPPGHAPILLIRQVEPGKRIKCGFYFNVDWLPLPDDEATAHALFEMAAEREPVPRNGEALDALIQKYVTDRSQ